MTDKQRRMAGLAFRRRTGSMATKYPSCRYVEYLSEIKDPDFTSRILVEIPSYLDDEIVPTVRSALAMAASPERVSFAVCLQGMPGDERLLDGVPRTRMKFMDVSEARGSCLARYLCQDLYSPEEKDFVLYTDSHMRFAYGWDVAELDQWRQASALSGHNNVILSNYAADYTDLASDPPESDRLTAMVKPGKYVGMSYYWHDEPTPIMWIGKPTGTEHPVPGAFTGCAHVFAPAALDGIRFDPDMCFLGDEAAMAARWWTHGYDIYHPGFTHLFHMDKQAARPRQSGHRKSSEDPVPGGASPRDRELARMKVLYGLSGDPGSLGAFGPGTARSMRDYHRFAGIDLRGMTVRRFSRYGPFFMDLSRHDPKDLEFFDWREHHGLTTKTRIGPHTKQLVYMDPGTQSKLKARPGTGSDTVSAALSKRLDMLMPKKNSEGWFRFETRRRLLAAPDAPYLKWLEGIPDPDMSSTILIELAAYADTELLPTIRAALAMAANPERVHIAVCAQNYDGATLKMLDRIPECRYEAFSEADTPGLCGARECAQNLNRGEDYSLSMDSHMRFAYGWDVCLIYELSRCRSEKPVLTSQPPNYAKHYALRPDHDIFTNGVEMRVRILNASFFSDFTYKLRTQIRATAKGTDPVLGAFTAGGMVFGKLEHTLQVPFDPEMFFVADEHSMAIRYWTRGFDIWHPYANPIWHLYDRANVVKSAGGPDQPRFPASGVNRLRERLQKEEPRRIAELVGLSDRYEYGLEPGTRYGLGTERTIEQYFDFSGVDLRNLSIRKFARDGRFDVPHGPADMAFVDWFEARSKDSSPPAPKDPPEAWIPDAQLEKLKTLASMTGTPWRVLLQQAVRDYLD